MTTSDNISAIEAIEKAADAILAKVPHGYGMTRDEALIYAETALSAYPAILEEARKVEAMEREIAELRKLLAGDHELKPLSEERLDEILEFEEQFKMLGGADDTASLDWETQRALIDEAVLACRARTLLNGGSDAQPL